MQKLREDKIQGKLASYLSVAKLEKVMGFWIELYNEEMQHTWWRREMHKGFW